MKTPTIPPPLLAAALSPFSPFLPPRPTPQDIAARLAGPDEKARKSAPRLLTVRETVERLRISRPTLYARIAEGVLPVRRVGARTFIPESAVEGIEAGTLIVGHPVRRARNAEGEVAP